MEQEEIEQFILEVTGAERLLPLGIVQSLWSGYGRIERIGIEGGDVPSVIVKHVQPGTGNHPRGWNTDLSHQRKLKSYKVETHWYERQAQKPVAPLSRIPKCFGTKATGGEFLLVLEDLDAAGYAGRRSSVTREEMYSCVRWLAQFHADCMGINPEGLWATGTYWHLETRPHELEKLDDIALKDAALTIDTRLKASAFQTLVHGDAKLANFCFRDDGHEVAALDFQYVGGGCGMKDLAYFVGSCLRDDEAEDHEEEILDFYFRELSGFLGEAGQQVRGEALEADWRPLYRVAWADFHRFMKGWSPGHWKLSDYSERVTRDVIVSLKEDMA
ncbi:MAG: phosphotransferase [Verrucomicrobiota bacterium]|nr:phosphotransferase [Verrucomicrobiota bacterium]